MELPDTDAYIQAHNGILHRMQSGITEQISQALDRRVVIKDENAEPLVIGGLVSADEITNMYRARGVELTEEVAAEIAEEKNRQIQIVAEVAIGGLQAVASMDILKAYRTEHPDDSSVGLPWQEAGESFNLVPYHNASMQSARRLHAAGSLTLSFIQIDGIKGGYAAREHRMTNDDNYMTQIFVLRSLNDLVTGVDYTVKPTQDPLMQRCAFILGEDFSKIIGLISSEEDDIDAELNEIWLSHQGTAKEEETGLLLDEVKQRIRAFRQNQELKLTHGLFLPDQETLAGLARLVGPESNEG